MGLSDFVCGLGGFRPIVSIVVPFWGYLIGSKLYIWLNQKKELQWRLEGGSKKTEARNYERASRV